MSEVEMVEAQREISLGHRRRIGATIFNMRRVAKELKAQGELASDRRERAAQIAGALVDERFEEFETCMVEDGRDWAAFFEALMAFIEKLMPVIMLFL